MTRGYRIFVTVMVALTVGAGIGTYLEYRYPTMVPSVDADCVLSPSGYYMQQAVTAPSDIRVEATNFACRYLHEWGETFYMAEVEPSTLVASLHFTGHLEKRLLAMQACKRCGVIRCEGFVPK